MTRCQYKHSVHDRKCTLAENYWKDCPQFFNRTDRCEFREKLDQMKRCSDECSPICDFCYYFRSGHWLRGPEDDDIENGYCVKHKRQQDLTHECENFTCFEAVNIFQKFYFWFVVTRKIHSIYRRGLKNEKAKRNKNS